MKKLIAMILVLMTVLSMTIPMMASAESMTKWVNCADGKNLNVRREATTAKNNVMYRIECGTQVQIDTSVAAPAGWVYVTVKGHKNGGFVMSKFLVEKKPGKYEITERSDNFRTVTPYVVTTKALNANTDRSVGLRTSPNKTAKMIRRLNVGDRLQVVAVGKVWSKVIDLSTGRTGYMANDYMIRL